MKKYLIIGLIIVVLLSLIGGLLKSNRNLREQVRIESNNYKAELYAKDGKNRTLQLTIDQFKYQQDSTMKLLDSVVKDNKLKYKTIKSLQYTNQSISITDTIVFRDTIFRENINIDTTLNREHYQLYLGLRYPKTIIDSLYLENGHYAIFHTKRETIKPKKCWPLSWFQRRQTICEVTVGDTNPIVKSKESKFIEIIK